MADLVHCINKPTDRIARTSIGPHYYYVQPKHAARDIYY